MEQEFRVSTKGKKLLEVKKLALALMGEYGLLANGWTFGFDTARRRFGVCYHGKRRITLSAALVELNSIEESRNTITHEIAHALMPRGAGHSPGWVAMHRSLGGDGKRCYDSAVVVKPAAPIVGECPGGHPHTRFKMPRRSVSCSACSPRYDERYKIIWKRI